MKTADPVKRPAIAPMASIDRRTFLKAAAGTALATGASRLGASPTGPRKRPNILLISTDQQSFHAMSCKIGKHNLHTPNMDRLATGGMQFTRAYAANPLCFPSRTAMYSGRYPVETSFQINPDPHFPLSRARASEIDWQQFPCMGTAFKNAGYETAYFGKWHTAYPSAQTETHGFDTMKAQTFDPLTVTQAVSFLNQKHDKPFLAVASFMNPHNICEWARGQKLPDGPIGAPPDPASCPSWRKDYGSPKDEPAIMTLMRHSYQNDHLFPVGNFDENKWRQYEWAYYRLIEKVDAQIGQVLDAVYANHLERDTAIVFFSDHGDCQGAHHWNQKTVFYEESAQVCFLVNWQGTVRPGESDRLVNTGVDLIPTVCGLAGIPRPAHSPGESLAATALGSKAADPREYIVASNDLAQGGPVDGITPRAQGRMVRSRRYKYCVYTCPDKRVANAPRESLVDFEKDPGEMVNLAADPQYHQILLSHRAMLREWATTYKDNFPLHA